MKYNFTIILPLATTLTSFGEKAENVSYSINWLTSRVRYQFCRHCRQNLFSVLCSQNHRHITITLNIAEYQHIDFSNTRYYHITVTLKLIPKMVNISNIVWLCFQGLLL